MLLSTELKIGECNEIPPTKLPNAKDNHELLKRITYTDNAVICLKLRDNLFTLAQMRHRWFMQFFDLTNPTDEFNGVDLNKVDSLFCIIVAEKPLLPLMVKKNRPRQSYSKFA